MMRWGHTRTQDSKRTTQYSSTQDPQTSMEGTRPTNRDRGGRTIWRKKTSLGPRSQGNILSRTEKYVVIFVDLNTEFKKFYSGLSTSIRFQNIFNNDRVTYFSVLY